MDFAAARFNMVENQIRANKVTDSRVIGAFMTLPRENFVPKSLRGIAYVDEDLDIGGGRHLLEPMVLARLLQALDVKASDVALDIGCGSGFSAAALARLAATVVALESDAELARRAQASIAELGIDNVVVVETALTAGYAAQAPFDVILCDGAVADIPAAILAQLADGGRLAAVVAEPGSPIGRATLVTRTGDSFGRKALFDASTHILPGFAKAPSFAF